MPSLNILISGCSVAGPALAFWLLRAGATVTIVERDPELRRTGQSVDIRDRAVDIIKAMGLEPAIRAKHTSEKGVQFINPSGTVSATFAASGDENKQNFTSEYEIFRGDLAGIFFDATKDRAKYIFGDYIKNIVQTPEAAHVDFANGTPSASYDLVVAADGLGSRVRAMALNTTTREHLRPLGMYMAYFTVYEDLLEGSDCCKWWNAPGGRMVLLRPDPRNYTRANLVIYNPKDQDLMDRLRSAAISGHAAVKAIFHELFDGTGWLSDKILKGMDATDDFYLQEVAQIKTDELFKGRITMIGDAAYCPCPLTGMGTSLALTGAYILAGEIMSQPHDLPSALARYQDIMIPYAREIQKLPPGMPGIMYPQTAWRVTIMYRIITLVSWTGILSLIGKIVPAIGIGGKKLELPNYAWPR